ncbi:MAG: acetyl-CoA carboxylase biotin carboxyl carrier protein subunit [bacterium]|jgi:biotin carboxyl carrier protein|nr:acetyl-CoA carboxylase biotin carboxyl carrier protein subunit [candidate division KSB1 bacterium]MDH7559213.1 acetyl-CoA carboxylase biotin carboxyl carrier protein subunit [bacterium]
MPGKLIRLFVHPGDRVRVGDRLAVLQAMKMEHDIRAPVSGTVSRLNCAEEALVDGGQPLFEIEPDHAESSA